MTHFFDTRYFSRHFSTQKIFFDTYRYRYRSKAGGAPSPRYKAADHTGRGPYTSPGKERSLQTVQIPQKHIFSRLFRHKRSFFDTYRYRYRSMSGAASSPRHIAADHTAGGPSPGPGKKQPSNGPKYPYKRSFSPKKSHYYLTDDTLTGTGTAPNWWGLDPQARGVGSPPEGTWMRD